MRDFARPDVLFKAAIAALVSTLACLPRLAQWTSDREAVLILAVTLGWCVFVMWGFVFAWSARHAKIVPFQRPRALLHWGGLTLAAILAGTALSGLLDAEYRRLFPGEVPASGRQWFASVLFNLSLQQLFLCFAPIAFFARLGAGPRTTIGLTVALSLTVLTMKLNRAPFEPSAFAIVGWILARGTLAAGAVMVYRSMGVIGVWWLALLLHCRHLPRALAGE